MIATPLSDGDEGPFRPFWHDLCAMTRALGWFVAVPLIYVTPPTVHSTLSQANRDRLIILAATLAVLTLVVAARVALRRFRYPGKPGKTPSSRSPLRR